MGGHDLPGVRQSLPYFGLGFEDKNGKFELGCECVWQKAFPWASSKFVPADSGDCSSKPEITVIFIKY